MRFYPSNSQREQWRKKFIDRERRMLAYFASRSADSRAEEPDGSFLLGAYLNGWESAMRKAKSHQNGPDRESNG